MRAPTILLDNHAAVLVRAHPQICAADQEALPVDGSDPFDDLSGREIVLAQFFSKSHALGANHLKKVGTARMFVLLANLIQFLRRNYQSLPFATVATLGEMFDAGNQELWGYAGALQEGFAKPPGLAQPLEVSFDFV
jgi:hypothetical protein